MPPALVVLMLRAVGTIWKLQTPMYIREPRRLQSVIFMDDELNPRLAQAAVAAAARETPALTPAWSQSAVPGEAVPPPPSSISQRRSLASKHVDDMAAALHDPGSDIAVLTPSVPKLPPMKLSLPQPGTPGYEPSYSTYTPERTSIETSGKRDLWRSPAYTIKLGHRNDMLGKYKEAEAMQQTLEQMEGAAKEHPSALGGINNPV
ncbi:hypothetical protein GE09DRAFT_1267726 [Coniochaeta sp. 2T2.1]|nr:hypothetical protein GE09DRAFT_1267726 [Coniochaeta sp. 2T2.1]